MTRIFLIAALFALPTTAAFAAIDTNALISGLQADGYTRIEVTRGIDQTKVEAIKGDTKAETVYDNETGAVISNEVGIPDADEDIRTGVTIRDRNRNFADADQSDEDSSDDDSNDDDSNDDDDDNGDNHGGDDHGGDDDHDDDNGSDDDHGGDDHDGDDD